VAWFDDDGVDGDGESESTKHVTAMTGRIVSESDSSDENLYHEKLIVRYNNQDVNDHLQEERIGHLAKNSELNNEVILLSSQLDHVLKQVRMMTTRTDVLDKMLEGQIRGKPNGIGFSHEHLRQEHQNNSYDQTLDYYHKAKKKKPVRKIKFVASTRTGDTTVKEQMLQHSIEPNDSEMEKVSSSWKCHHCNKKGHIKPFCYKLYGYPMLYQPKLHEPVASSVKKEWRPKCVGLISHTSLRVSSSEDWYFDSGCSRHMTGEDTFLEMIRPYATSYVTFGDGAKRKIVGVGNLVNEELPRLDNVLLVKGLTANLINIS